MTTATPTAFDVVRRSVRVTFEDGNTLTTEINGTKQDVVDYYVGKRFPFGIGEREKMVRAVAVDFLEG